MKIRITSTPDGGAPKEIRDKWVGLVLPVDHENNEQLADLATLARTQRTGGYAVRWKDAMKALDYDTRQWWEENLGGSFSVLVFQTSCCELVQEG